MSMFALNWTLVTAGSKFIMYDGVLDAETLALIL